MKFKWDENNLKWDTNTLKGSNNNRYHRSSGRNYYQRRSYDDYDDYDDYDEPQYVEEYHYRERPVYYESSYRESAPRRNYTLKQKIIITVILFVGLVFVYALYMAAISSF